MLALRCLLVAVAAALALAICPGTGRAQQPAQGPPQIIDGPSPDITSLGGMSIARDGTGGLVYLKQVGGVAHVFVSRLLSGVFQPPEQVDAGLGAASSQPVIAAGNGGLLLVAFINSGELFVVDRLGSTATATAPLPLASGASNPAISISDFGKAYLAFADAGTGGNDVRSAYFYAGQWALEPAPLDANPSDDAGSGTGRPAVVAAGDGVGIVAWGETGHIYTRRVWGTSPSVVFEQADPPTFGGWNEQAAEVPVIGSGGDSSYAAVAFGETFASGSQTQTRVLSRTLRGSQFTGTGQPDGLSTPGSEGGTQPRLAVSEYNHGFVTAARGTSNGLYAMSLGNNDTAGPVARVDSLTNSGPPDAVPAMAGLYSDLIAWQQNPGTAGTPEIRFRYAPDGVTLGPEVIVSSPTQGPTNADSGLAAAGDVGGDAALVWVQGDPADQAIVAAQLYQPPGSLAPVTPFSYSRTNQPSMAWTAARDLWGPIKYTVTLDGALLSPTTSTTLTPSEPLADGLHVWRVIATNPGGQTSRGKLAGRVWVDTVAPVGTITLTGNKRPGAYLHLNVTYTDAPPPEPPASASGVARVVVRFGDGSSYTITHGKFHAYKKTGRYRLTVTLTDRAGNTTTLVQIVRIAPKTKSSSKRKSKSKPKPHHSTLHTAGRSNR